MGGNDPQVEGARRLSLVESTAAPFLLWECHATGRPLCPARIQILS